MIAVAGLCLGLAVAVSRRGRPGRGRLPAIPRRPRPRRAWAVVLLLAFAGLGLALIGPGGLIAVAAAGGLTLRHRLRRKRPFDAGDIALCIDLLGGTLAAGAAPAAALAAVASAAPSAAREAFSTAATALARGDDPGETWSRLADVVPSLGDAARLCGRAAVTGAAVAEELHRLAAALRAGTQVERRRRLQRAAVWQVLPLGLCFLPAFVLVGVIPVVLAAVPGLLR